ncbi:MAG: sulfotransferase [Hormoscilla sp.]
MSVREPIFILAAPRSFTSLISTMLGQHPEAYGVPELNLFFSDTLKELIDAYLWAIIERRRLSGLLRTVSQLYAGEQTIESVGMAHRWLLNRLDHSTGEIYWELCAQVAPLRIVDKSPMYSSKPEKLPRIAKTFPNAHYLHLIRHPRTHGESVMKMLSLQSSRKLAFESTAFETLAREHSTNLSRRDPQYLWYRTQRNILDFLSTVPAERQMRLRGEDLLNDPRSHFANICQWLNFAWDESILETMLHPDDSPYACFGPYGAHMGNDPNFMKSPAYRYRPVTYSQLEGPLPWRQDNKGFLRPVIKLAQEFGYE